MFDLLLQGFDQVLTLSNFLLLASGVALGTLLGAIPGLTATMAIAVVIPFTFSLDPVGSILMLLGAYKGGIYGGSIAAILIAAPGTPASAATVQDGHALAKRGQGLKALKVALIASTVADLITDIVLILAAAQLASVALAFGPAEYMAVAVIGLTIVSAVSGRSLAKGLVAALLGALVALVGLDPITGLPRFSFGIIDLYSGISLIPMLIGLLTVSEVLLQFEKRADPKRMNLPEPKDKDDGRVTRSDVRTIIRPISVGTTVGCLIGMIPGLGPTLGAFLGYDAAWRLSRNRAAFGKGSLEAVAGAESGNNAVSGANLIPLLGLGIPGDTMAAILVGAFLIHGLTPGPLIFQEAPEVVYGVYAGLITANFLLIGIVWWFLRVFTRAASIPGTILYPGVLIFCVLGSYAFNQSLFDVWVMFGFGVLGYIMAKLEFPRPPLLVGFILAPLLEENFRRAMIISDSDPGIFFSTPLAIGLWITAALSLVFILRQRRWLRHEIDGRSASSSTSASDDLQ